MHAQGTHLMSQPRPLDGLKVLLVEDEFLIAVDAEDLLRELGASEVSTANTFEEAEARVKAGGFDVAVLDVNLNGKMSFPIGRLLRERSLPFVFASGYTLESRAIPGLENEIYITKPYQLEQFRDRLGQAIACRRTLPVGKSFPLK